VRSYNFVVRGLSCAAISCAFSSVRNGAAVEKITPDNGAIHSQFPMTPAASTPSHAHRQPTAAT